MNNKAKLSRLSSKDFKVIKKDSLPEMEPCESRERIINNVNTTPIAQKTRDDPEEELLSPCFMHCTQDEEQDVDWEWDSPRSKNTHTLFRKRVVHSSPKIPKKHIPSSRNMPRFNSLKAELEQLANKLQMQNEILTNSNHNIVKPPVDFQNTEDPFKDDSFDEELVKCSQKVEETFLMNKWCSSIMNYNEDKLVAPNIQDDSFDMFLEEIKDEDINKLSQASSSSSVEPLIVSKPNLKVSSPRSISRTISVPTDFFKKSVSAVTTNLLNRTRSDDTGKSEKIPCSPEEIEKKRQEARAKLESKRRQYEIEKKRLEALQRLARNRKQKMLSQNCTQLKR